MTGLEGSRCLHHAANVSSDDALIRPAHTNVALKRSTAWEDRGVSRWDMGVCAENSRDLSIQEAAQHLFVARRLGVNVH